jgi:hypothetical protein
MQSNSSDISTSSPTPSGSHRLSAGESREISGSSRSGSGQRQRKGLSRLGRNCTFHSPRPQIFTAWPEPDATWAAFPAEYQGLIAQIPNRAARPNQASRQALRELIREQAPQLVAAGEPAWTEIWTFDKTNHLG